GEFFPDAILPAVERKGFDALAERQILAQPDSRKHYVAPEIDNQFGRLRRVVTRPISITPGVNRVARSKAPVAIAAAVTGADLRPLRQVFGKRRVEQAAKLAQRLNVGGGDLAAPVGR